MRILVNICLALVSAAIGLVLVEAAYRAWLRIDRPALFAAPAPDDKLSFAFYDKSHWEFDAAEGYVYPPGRKIVQGNVSDSRLVSCDRVFPINERGNIGPIRGDYDSAALKILVFGDSFPAYIVDGETFPSTLQALLNGPGGQDASVVNFGRDGTGILQMVDLAARKVPEWQPDLVIFAFTTDDLDRTRIWRTATRVDGAPRILVTDRPDPAPDLAEATDAFVWFPDGDMEWCDRVLAAAGRGPELDALVARYRRMKDAHLAARPGLGDLDHSFVLALLLNNDPMLPLRETRVWTVPRITLSDYRDDPAFVAAMDRLQATGVPLLFLHLAIAPELEAGALDLSARRVDLWRSLEEAIGRPIDRMDDLARPPVDDPVALSHQPPANHHPSRYGMRVYAAAAARLLDREGLVAGLPAEALLRPPAPARNKGPRVEMSEELLCPFQLIDPDAGATPDKGPQALPWTVFSSHIERPSAEIEVTATAAEGPDCRFRVTPVATPAHNGFDWRIGHVLEMPARWQGRTARVRMTLRADTDIALDRGMLYVYDGTRYGVQRIAGIGPEGLVLDLSYRMETAAPAIEMWLRLAYEAPIGPAGTITMSDASIEILP